VELAPLPDGVHDKVRAILEIAGVETMYGAQGRLLNNGLSLNAPDPADRARAVEEVMAGVAEARRLGARKVGVLSGPNVPAGERKDALDRLIESLIELCARAEKEDAFIVLEVFDADVDKKLLVGPAADAAEVAARVTEKQQNFGLLVDLSHIPLLGETPEQALRPVAPWLTHVHIGSCVLEPADDPLYGDKHPRFNYPAGVNRAPEVAAFIAELFRTGYLDPAGKRRGTVSFEVRPQPGENPELVIADARRTLAAAWAAVRADGD